MRVGLAIETDSPGGAETMLLELARGLRDRGVHVHALGPVGGAGWLTAELADLGVERDLIEFDGPFGTGAIRRIASFVTSRRLDVLHSHEFLMSVMGAFATRGTSCKHVITMHGGLYYASNLRRRAGMRMAAELSAHTVAVSGHSRDVLARALRVEAGRIRVVPNGVTPASGSGDDIRRELGLGPEDVMLLAVGNLYPVKGHAYLIEAIGRMRPADGRIVLAVAGQGGEEHSLRNLTERRGLADVIHFLGFRSDVPDLLDAADIFVMPSLSEGLPMAMIEAMLAGKAIVASEVGGIPELIVDGRMGLLVEPENPEQLARRLEEVVEDEGLRKRLGRAARARAEASLTSSAMVSRYLALYGE